LGELPHVDVALHADTTHEREKTYAFAAQWIPWLEEHGMRVVTIKAPVQGFLQVRDLIGIPAYTDSDGKGQLTRMCTNEWKIAPMRRFLSEELNGSKKPGAVELWLGISLDEVERMKPADVKYIVHRWPLIEKRMTRHDCERWLLAHGLEIPPKSSCVFCPYHNRALWRELQQEGGQDWTKAVETDEFIRKARPPYDLYLHRELIPLMDVDMRTEEERGQLSLFGEECSGVCGV
jgi:hypothetical protein